MVVVAPRSMMNSDVGGSINNVVHVEDEVTASHLYGRSCTNINNLNILNVANVDAEVTASHVHGRSCTELDNSDMDGFDVDSNTSGEICSEDMSDTESTSASAEDMEEVKVITALCCNCHHTSMEPPTDVGIDFKIHPFYRVVLSSVSIPMTSF